jgi:hypothetical protein
MAWHTPDDDADNPSAGRLGVADPLTAGEQAHSSSVIHTAVELHQAGDGRTVRPTRERSDIASQPALGSTHSR